ncbi:hypothetical protein [Paenibacillus sp. LHD-38]|uniref:hypothetical protein n=1 Tax=Paenibacillus sp. LHD-38 TaxID=3072143 RepID=UPI00280D22CB|nr:hypothetical protein [Paenibacillus sp. LHD-38]MDQ8739317.1 hypothetical protein [Paenibacillus sp. LHD-38]
MTTKTFQFEMKTIQGNEEHIIDVQPIINESNKFLILTTTRKIIELDTNENVFKELFVFDNEEIVFEEKVSLLVSPNAELITVYNTFGRQGIVIDISSMKTIMRFNRDDYHYEQTIFPVAFVNYNAQLLLIHGTKWNRLDITNPIDNQALTDRDDPKFQLTQSKSIRSEHYLDYFHGQLVVSPDNKWIVDNGWVWHPMGCVTGWSIHEWIENRWESEDGMSKKDLWCEKEDWNDPLCWISDNEIGLVGRNNYDFIDGDEPHGWIFRVMNVETGNIVKEFPISSGNIFIDTYLFSCLKETGIKIYDLNSGILLFEDEKINPDNYHHKSKEFIGFDNEQIMVYKLIEEECNCS